MSTVASCLYRHDVSFELFPLSYAEYRERVREEASGKSYAAYMEGCSLPRLSTLSTEDVKWNYVSSIKDTALFRDIVQQYRVKDPFFYDTAPTEIYAY